MYRHRNGVFPYFDKSIASGFNEAGWLYWVLRAAQEKVEEKYVAGASVALGQVVYVSGADLVAPASSANVDHAGKVVGFALNGGEAGKPISVMSNGFIENDNWALTEGGEVYLSAGGGITQTPPPAGGFLQQVGVAKSEHVIAVKLSPPVELLP